MGPCWSSHRISPRGPSSAITGSVRTSCSAAGSRTEPSAGARRPSRARSLAAHPRSGASGVFIHGGGPLPGEDGRTDDRNNRRLRSRAWKRSSRSAPARIGRAPLSRWRLRFLRDSQADHRFRARRRPVRARSPITTDQPFDPQVAIATGRYSGKVITVDSELEWFSARAAEDGAAAPGCTGPTSFPARHTYPTPCVPSSRTRQRRPAGSRSSSLPLPAGECLGEDRGAAATEHPARDDVERRHRARLERKRRARRHHWSTRAAPALRGARRGHFRHRLPRHISAAAAAVHSRARVRTHSEYLAAFDGAVANQLSAGSLLPADAQSLRDRARLAPPAAFTENYFASYEDFRSSEACP